LPLLSSTLRLLLALQKDVCNCLFGKEFLLKYSIHLIKSVNSFLENLLKDKSNLFEAQVSFILSASN
jgi:hypothetical protein